MTDDHEQNGSAGHDAAPPTDATGPTPRPDPRPNPRPNPPQQGAGAGGDPGAGGGGRRFDLRRIARKVSGEGVQPATPSEATARTRKSGTRKSRTDEAVSADGAVADGAVADGAVADAAGAPGSGPVELETAPIDVREPALVGAGSVEGAAALARRSVFDDGPPPPLPPEPYDLDDEWVRLPPRSGPLRRSLIVIFSVGAIVAVIGFSVLRWIDHQVHPSGPHGAPVEFTIEQRQTTNVIASNLAAKHVIGNATVFRYWLRRQGGEQTFKAGDYDLFERMDYPELLKALRAGPKPPVFIRVTIPPGLTVEQIQKKLLEQLPNFDAEELKKALLMAQIDAPYVPPLPFPFREGLLFPDTYNVDEDSATNELALVKRMRDQMDKVLNDLHAADRAAQLGVSEYDILKIASLIEEEAKVDADRPKIARVIYNRLQRNMALGIDATTRFAVGKNAGEPLTQSDLDSDSPWNTRKAKGLPPTPIAAPSKKSIEAALDPTPDAKWLYYVLTDEGGVKGAHTFADNSRDFEAAKKICVEKGYC